MSDLLIRGGTVVDGTGAPGRRADVRVRAGRIVEVAAGLVPDGERVIDAAGAVVAPGFIDTHTHLDPALFWDPEAAVMSSHGVTSVLTGNCALSLMPVRVEDRDELSDAFGFIEDMTVKSFEVGVPWSWESYGEFRDVMRARSFGVNVAALIGHTPLRMWAMGGEAWTRAKPTVEELAVQVQVLEESLRLGAFGLSVSLIDRDRAGRPVPSSLADDDEFGALFDVLAAQGRLLEFVPDFIGPDPVGDIERFAQLCKPRDLSAAWNALVTWPSDPTLTVRLLEQASRLQAEGVRIHPEVSPRSVDLQISWDSSLTFTYIAAWNTFIQTPRADKLAMLADADWRAAAREDWDTAKAEVFPQKHLHAVQMSHLGRPDDQAWVGRTLDLLVADRGGHPSDVLADLLIDNELDVKLVASVANVDPNEVGQLLAHPTTVVSGSDAGAHQQMFCATGDTTLLLTRHVRERGDLTLEQAVNELTGRTAEIFGFTDRGIIEPGAHADLTIFALDELEYLEPVTIDDIPGGGWRYVRPPAGYRYTIVAGVITHEHGKPTHELPGQLLDAN